MLKKHGAALNFTTAEVGMVDQLEDSSQALADPEGLAWQVSTKLNCCLKNSFLPTNKVYTSFLQVLNAAWDVCIPVASENSVPCNSREVYNKILENAKPFNDPDGRHLLSFTYHRLSLQLMERHNLMEFERFVKKMHGETIVSKFSSLLFCFQLTKMLYSYPVLNVIGVSLSNIKLKRKKKVLWPNSKLIVIFLHSKFSVPPRFHYERTII